MECHQSKKRAMIHHRAPRHRFPALLASRGGWPIRNSLQIKKGEPRQKQTHAKQHCKRLRSIRLLQKPSRTSHRHEQGRLRSRLIKSQKSTPHRFRYNRTDPRQITTQGNPSSNIEKKQKKENENLPRRFIHRKREPHHQSHPTDHHTATDPSPQNKSSVTHLLHKTRCGNLKDIH